MNKKAQFTKLETAKAYYAGNPPQPLIANQLMADWIRETQHVITEPYKEQMFVYDVKKGHYRKTGKALIKAIIAKSLNKDANKGRTSEIIEKVSALSFKDQDEIEEMVPLHIIPLKNGNFNLKTGELEDHSPKYFFTYVHPIEYNKDADCPQIDQFLSEICQSNQKEALVDIPALCLYRERLTRNFFILSGAGQNGKSKYIDVIRAIVGPDRCVSVTPQKFEERPFASSLLHDKHANLGADIPGGLIRDASTIKSVTGGDTITVERKGKDAFETKPYCELIYSSNDPPRFAENTDALWTRLVVLKFPFTFVPENEMAEETHKLIDKNISEKLLKPKELSGFLNKILERLQDLIQKRQLSIEYTPEEMRQEYSAITNSPVVFLEQRCKSVMYIPGDTHTSATGWVSRAELYKAYQEFCLERKIKIETSATFGRRIKDAPGWDIDGSGNAKESVGGERILSYRGVELSHLSPKSPKSPILSPTLQNSYVQNKGNSVTPMTALTAYEVRFIDGFNTEHMLQNIRNHWSAKGDFMSVDMLEQFFISGCDQWIHDRKRNGDIYEPRPGFVGVID